MNRIFKVIWSKTKHCYIVVSEYAKANTKAVHTGLRTTAAAAAVAAMLLAPVNYNYVWAADTTTVTDTSTVQQTVYTKDGADNTFATRGSLTTEAADRAAADTKEAADRAAADTTLQSNIDKEAAVRETADTKLQTAVAAKANADDVYSKTDADNKFATKTEVNTADENLQKSIDEEARKRKYSVTNLEKADQQLQTNIDNEAADRKAADKTLQTNIDNEAAVRQSADENLQKSIDEEARKRKYSVTNLEKADQQLQTNIDNEAADRKAADKTLQTNIDNEAAVRQSADENLQKSIDEEARKRKYSVTNLENADKQLQANIDNEAAARKEADNTLQTNIDNEAATREEADKTLQTNIDNEAVARKAADTKLVEAVNSGLSLSDDNVLQKDTTTIDDQGNVTPSKTDAKEMILNKGKDNQITLSDKGIKVGLNSGVMDQDGFYAGADDYAHASAALQSDGSIKGADGKFTVDADGKVTAAYGKIGNVEISSTGAVSGVTDLTASGTITGNKLTDGVASLQNGNLTTTGNINAHDIVATGDISGKVITGTSLNTQGGAISGGAITGTTITGTTGAFGSLTTTGNASVGGTLFSNGLTNTGNATTDTLTVNHNATVGGNLAVTGDITGKSLNVGTGAISGGQITGTGLDVGAGTIKTTGAVETRTLETTGNATIGGDLTVDKNLTVNGTFDAKTLSSTVDANNYTTINGGKTQSMNLKVDAATSETKASASTFDENGSNTWAKDDDSIGRSTVTADGISQRLSDTGDNPTVYAERTMSQGTDNKYSMVDTVKDGDKTNVASQSATESSDVVTAANGNTSTFRQRVDAILQELKNADGGTLTKVEQTDTAITSQIGDGSAIKSVMDANGIANTATGKSITNDAADIINEGTNSVTNQVGSNKVVVDTTGVKSAYGDNTYTTWNAEGIINSTDGNMTNTVGGNKSETVAGTSTETVTGKKTENYNGGLETTVTGEEKHTVNGSQTNAITGNQTNTIGGSQTTTVTGDSSLTAENINNTAKNKITNKALDVETDAASSIVSKVSNDYGSNTSTQTSNETKEAMSQADGKTASYLRGAAEEKSQLIDGSKKTTIDTIAGQTNTNITDGTNTSNDLQKADQIASSVTDGTNTTVVNQNAKSLASSITDGTKANNTNSTVDKSEQLIKASDTQFYAETRTAEKAEEALRSGNTVINIVKDTKTATVSSAVTDGATITGISQNAKDISLSAAGGTITNTAKKLVNTATGDMENKVGGNLTNNVTGNMTSNVTGDSSLSAKNITNTAEEKLSNSAAEIENSASKSITDKVGANVERTMTTKKISESVKDDTKSNSFSKTAEKDINIITDGTKTSTLSQLADSVNTSLKEVDGEGKTTKSLSNLKTVSEDTTKMTDAATGEFSKRSQTVSQIQDQVGKTTVTTTEGLTKLTNEGGTHKTEMDFADVLKNLGVRGNAAVDGNTTLGKEDADTTLTVNSKSTFKDTVKMEKTLEVDGTSNFNDKVTVTKGGLNVTGGTTTDTLHVTRTSTFDGTATFKDIVTMEQDLSVGGNATVAGDVTANSYKVGDKTYIDANGVNANGQKIKNVAAGTEDSDAANYGQLRKVERRVDGVENRVTNVENRVDKMDSRIDKVGANAAAMANLHPLEFDEDSKWNVAAAVGNYKGETAAAVGAFYRPNEDVMFNLSTTFGNDENMVGGGLSLRLGKGGNHEKDKKLKAAIAENNDLRAKVDDLTARMDALLSVINPNMSKEFPDVPENHWAYEAVTRLAGNDIVQGYEDGKFHGERTMTRYEMAEIIYNALSRGAKAEKKLVEEFKPELQAMAAQKQAK